MPTHSNHHKLTLPLTVLQWQHPNAAGKPLLELVAIQKALQSAGLEAGEDEPMSGHMVSENMMVIATKQGFVILVEGTDGAWTQATQPKGGAPPRRKIQV
jgi:hypothetical protein